MNFNENFRLKLQTSLINNILFLKESSIDVVNEVKDDYRKIILNIISDEFNPFKISPERAIYNINRTLESSGVPKLKLRFESKAVFRINEIEFKVITNDEPELHSKEELQLRVDTENFLYECQNEFWRDINHNSKYYEISDFSCIEDFEFPVSKLELVTNSAGTYNVEAWSQYVFKLVEMNFPDFKYEKSKSNRKVRFLKSLNDDIQFGFEYDNTELKKEINRKTLNRIQLPYYFNVIIINKNFNPREKKEYVIKYDNDIMSLGIVANPFFYHPCYPLSLFGIIELYHYGNFYPDNTKPKKVRDCVKVNDETMKMVYSKEYFEKLKKYAFFYMHLLGYSSKSYLDYLEKSILDIL